MVCVASIVRDNIQMTNLEKGWLVADPKNVRLVGGPRDGEIIPFETWSRYLQVTRTTSTGLLVCDGYNWEIDDIRTIGSGEYVKTIRANWADPRICRNCGKQCGCELQT